MDAATIPAMRGGPSRFLAEHEVRGKEHEKEPTPGQLRAGNYPKHHWKMHGLDIAIENLAGTRRKGTDQKGEPWEVVMPYHYGYIKGTEGADGDHLDVAVGPLMGNGTEAHIINQKGPEGGFDEHKVFIGYPSREEAIRAFRQGRSDNPDDVMGEVLTVSIDHLKEWIAKGKLKREAVVKALPEVAKAEGKAHVKSHYRTVNGKVVYIHDYDKATHGDHPEATLQERTILKQTKHGHTIQVTDSEDNEKVKAAMTALGVQPHLTQHTGAAHHGLKKAVFQHHFTKEGDAQAVHAMLNENHGAPVEPMAEGEVHDEGAPPPKKKAQKIGEGIEAALGKVALSKVETPGPDTGPAGADRGPSTKEVQDDMEAMAAGFCTHFDDITEADYGGEQEALESFNFKEQELADLVEADPSLEALGEELHGKMMHSLGRAILNGGSEELADRLKDDHFFEEGAAFVGRAATLGQADKARALLQMYVAARIALNNEASDADPEGIGSMMAMAKTMIAKRDQMAPFTVGYGDETAQKLAAKWYGETSGVFDAATQRFTDAQTKYMQEIDLGQKDIAADIAAQGFPEAYGFQRQMDAFDALGKLAGGSGQEGGHKAFYEAKDGIEAQMKEAKVTASYMKVDPSKALEHAGSLQAAGMTQHARHQFMLAAMSYHHRAKIAEKQGKPYSHILEAAQQAAASAHALA
jgi:hypothetical protein